MGLLTLKERVWKLQRGLRFPLAKLKLIRAMAHSSNLTQQSVIFIVWVTLIPGAFNPAQAGAGTEEYSLKAAFLFKFGFYVEWPYTAFSSPYSPINLCIAGNNPFGDAIVSVLAKESISGRTVSVHRLRTVNRNSSCHILYTGASSEQSSEQMLEAVRGKNVLTISDESSTPSQAGIINFVVEDDRVRFEIDNEAAAQNGLVISSKLLSLALNVKQRAPSENH